MVGRICFVAGLLSASLFIFAAGSLGETPQLSHLFFTVTLTNTSDTPTSPDKSQAIGTNADAVKYPPLATIRTASKRIIIDNAGNLGYHALWPGNNLNFFGDCDTLPHA